ncbi:uncharacterized protein LOC134542868 [Bacillus rossius redtenbacheri]|uniref:uncharacterized protein LOC134542868 n=1 Tax=Bacillus rossius redtenbacheri TaxID=93214 RepID=UPI002FDE1205
MPPSSRRIYLSWKSYCSESSERSFLSEECCVPAQVLGGGWRLCNQQGAVLDTSRQRGSRHPSIKLGADGGGGPSLSTDVAMMRSPWLSLALLLLVGARAAPHGPALRDSPGGAQPRETGVVGNVMARVDPLTEGRIRNVRVASEVPRLLGVDPDPARLDLRVSVSLGAVVVDGEVDVQPSATSPGFAGNVSVVYGDVSASGTAGVAVVQDVLQVERLELAYSKQNRSARVSPGSSSSKDLGEFVEAFFEGSVEHMVARELDRRVARQLDEALKGVSWRDVFGESAALQAPNPVSNVNLMADTLLAMMLPKIPSSVKLDDVDRPFRSSFLFVPVSGRLRATNGTLEDLRTLRRTSDALLNVTATGVRLTGALGLTELRFAYDYDVSVLGAGPSGRLEGSVGNNSIGFALAVTYDGRGGCAVLVEELSVLRLDDVKVKVTGLGILNWLASSITTSVVNDSKDKIVAHIEASLNRNLKSAADKAGFCDVFLGP